MKALGSDGSRGMDRRPVEETQGLAYSPQTT